MKPIITRTISGVVYIALILGSLVFDKSAFALVLFSFNIIALHEFQKFQKNNYNSITTIIIGAIAFIITHLISADFIAFKWIWLLVLSIIIISVFTLFSGKDNPISTVAFSLFGQAYITLPLILLNHLNIAANNTYSWYVICMFIIIWTSDTFAYLFGISFGKHKLLERISPKKTWEGFFGGLIAALIVAYLLFGLLEDIQLLNWLIISALIAIVSVIGDLVESLFKRSAGIKDSGNIMPGHGGILDRIDSLLFVVPIMYIYLQLINY